jgi:hypothetical protein
VIHPDADQIAEVIANDHAMLRQMHRFLYAVIGDADIGAILEELPAAIAAHSPFADERALVAVVQRETLQALHVLTLSRLPTKGNA